MSAITAIEKVSDPATRMRELLDRMSRRVRRRFLQLIQDARRALSLPRIETLVREGRVAEIIEVIDRAAARLGVETSTVFFFSAQSTATWLRSNGVQIDFDQANPNTLRAVRRAQLNLVTGFGREQRELLRDLLTEGARVGTNPRQLARELRESIGLTPSQAATVRRYRNLLQARSSDALVHELRDRRFDSRVAANARGSHMTTAQIEQVVSRYRSRWLGYRAEVIARTESLRAVHEGNEAMLEQAIEERALPRERLVRRWNSALDARVRDAHRTMHGQLRAYGDPFVSGAGNRLRHPGDRSAPASETVQCRCVVSTRIVWE